MKDVIRQIVKDSKLENIFFLLINLFLFKSGIFNFQGQAIFGVTLLLILLPLCGLRIYLYFAKGK